MTAAPINGQLELAGGPETLVDRAESMLSQQRYAQAIHLLDIVLSQCPNHPQGLAAAISAHQGLLADSDNFWLTSWLANQIKNLSAKQS